jgi:hypothetical protein
MAEQDRVSERVREQMAAFRGRRAARRAATSEFRARRQYGLEQRKADRLGLDGPPVSPDPDRRPADAQ